MKGFASEGGGTEESGTDPATTTAAPTAFEVEDCVEDGTGSSSDRRSINDEVAIPLPPAGGGADWCTAIDDINVEVAGGELNIASSSDSGISPRGPRKEG